MSGSATRVGEVGYFREHVAPFFPTDAAARFYSLERNDLVGSNPCYHGPGTITKSGYRGHADIEAAKRCAGRNGWGAVGEYRDGAMVRRVALPSGF